MVEYYKISFELYLANDNQKLDALDISSFFAIIMPKEFAHLNHLFSKSDGISKAFKVSLGKELGAEIVTRLPKGIKFPEEEVKH